MTSIFRILNKIPVDPSNVIMPDNTLAIREELIKVARKASIASEMIKHLQERIVAAYQFASEVGKAWCGSYLGYQSCVYFHDLQPKPAGAHFDMQWGLMDRFSNSSSGDWEEFDHATVYGYIDEQDASLMDELGGIMKDNVMMFCDLQDEALSILEANKAILDEYTLEKQQSIKALKLRTQQQFGIDKFPKGGSVMTFDIRARQEGWRLPPHLTYQAEIDFVRFPFRLLKLMSDYCNTISRHFERISKQEPSLMNPAKKIFIGHGKSETWKQLKDFVFEKLKLEYDEFNREPVAGLSTKERLEQMLANAGMAFLVMTAEDMTTEGKSHARLNVVHEAGLFQGRLGFNKAIILLEEGCEEFSNIHGLSQIRFPKGNLNSKREEIREVLMREGFL